MSKFSTNWALYDPLTPRKNKKINMMEMQIISDEIKKKIKLIEKAFC